MLRMLEGNVYIVNYFSNDAVGYYTGVATKVLYVAIGGIIFHLNKHLLIAVQMIQDLHNREGPQNLFHLLHPPGHFVGQNLQLPSCRTDVAI